MFLMATDFDTNVPTDGARCKTVAYNMLQIVTRNVGETEHDLMHHLLYAVIFAHCTNGLAKMTLGPF